MNDFRGGRFKCSGTVWRWSDITFLGFERLCITSIAVSFKAGVESERASRRRAFRRRADHLNRVGSRVADTNSLSLCPENTEEARLKGVFLWETERRHCCENAQRRTTKKRDARAIECAQGHQSPSVKKLGGGGAEKAMVSSPPQSPSLVDSEVQVQEKMSKPSMTKDELALRRERRKLSKKKSKFERVSLAKQVNDTTEVTQCHSRLKRRRQSRLPWLKTSEWRKFFFIMGEQSQSCDLRRAYCRKVPRWGFVLWSVVLVSSPFDTFSNE